MVFVKKRAYNDLERLRLALLKWDKVELTADFVLQYIQNIIDACFSLENLKLHIKSRYITHLRYGKYAFPFKQTKNSKTIQYIIYDIDKYDNIWIKKIISNHITIK